MFILSAVCGVALPSFDILTGEALNVLIMGFIPSLMAVAYGFLIRYVVTIEKEKPRSVIPIG